MATHLGKAVILCALTALGLLVPEAAAQEPSPALELYPPNLHLVVGETSAPLVVRDRNGQTVTGTLAFSNYDPSLISVSANGTVTALRTETSTEIGTWLRATLNGIPVSNATVVRVLSAHYAVPFVTVYRANTGLYFPATIAGEDLAAEVTRHQIPDINEFGYAIQKRLMRANVFNGARHIYEIDFGESETQRVCGISGNPVRLGWNITGLPAQNCFLGPFLTPRAPQWFVMHHEMGHNFLGPSATFANGFGLTAYIEGVASLLAIVDLEELVRSRSVLQINGDANASLNQQIAQYKGAWGAKAQTWFAQGAPFAQVDADIVDAIWLGERAQAPADFAERFFRPLQPRFASRLQSLVGQVQLGDQHTLFAALVSAASGQNLSSRFSTVYHFPIQPTFEAAFQAFLSILALPDEPLTLTAVVSGSTVTLNWQAPLTGPAPTGYAVDAGTSSGSANLGTGATGPSPGITVPNVPPGVYYVRVRSVGVGGTSGPSNEVQLQVGLAPPGAPSGLVATSSGTSVQLSWVAPATGGAPTGYVVEAGSGPGLVDLAVVQIGSGTTSLAAVGVPAGTYFIRVKAVNAGGMGAPTPDSLLQVGCTSPPTRPLDLRLISAVNRTVSMSWTASSGGADGYVVEVGSSSGLADLGRFDLGTLTAVTATGVQPGNYFVRVSGRNGCGVSQPSNELGIQVIP